MQTPENSRACPECGEKITGRSDKKYCSDACRSAFNNRLQSKNNQLISRINRQLQKNRNILAKLNPANSKIIVRKDDLITNGFSFVYHTHTFSTQKGHKYYFCYDYGYLALTEADKYLLVHQKKT
jgi:predicted nucleic acid-binding Zn ribbon protein